MAQVYFYPSQSLAISAIGTPGAIAPTTAMEVAGVDGTGDLRALSTDSSGNLNVNVENFNPSAPLATDIEKILGNPVSVSNPLPVHLTNGTAYINPALASQLPASLGQTTMSGSTSVAIASDQSAIAITAASLPLPTGASTSALQTQISGQLPASLGQKVSASSLAIVIASDQSTVPVSLASSPLPTGAATAANQTNGSQKTQIVDGSGNVIASTSNALNVDVTNTVAISASSLPLPTGAATSALQTTGNTTLSTISGQLPTTLGQKVSASSLAVVLASDQSTVPVSVSSLPVNKPNPTGSYAQGSISGVTTITAPANAVGFLLEADSANTDNMRWCSGSTASTSNGMKLEPGRDTGYMPLAANISIIPSSGTQMYTIQWVINQ